MLYKALNKAIVPALSKAIGRMPREAAIPNILDTLGTFAPPTLWTRTGSRFDIHDLDPAQFLGTNEGDLFCRGSRQTSGIVDTHTNLVSCDIASDWLISAKAPALDLSAGVMQVSFDGTGAAANTFMIAVASLDRVGRFQARLVSGAPGVVATDDYIGFRDGGTLTGTSFPLKDLTASFQDVDISVLSADQTDRVAIRSDNASAFVIEIIVDGAVDGTKSPARFPINSAAGATYGADLATAENAFDGGPINRSLITAIKNYTTGVVTSIDSIAPTTGDHVFDGTTDGNTERISWLSDAVITAGEITQAKAALEAVFNVDAGNCSFYALVDDEPVYVNGVPIDA